MTVGTASKIAQRVVRAAQPDHNIITGNANHDRLYNVNMELFEKNLINFIDNNGDLNERDNNGLSLLDYAVNMLSSKHVELLLKQKNINNKTKEKAFQLAERLRGQNDAQLLFSNLQNIPNEELSNINKLLQPFQPILFCSIL